LQRRRGDDTGGAQGEGAEEDAAADRGAALLGVFFVHTLMYVLVHVLIRTPAAPAGQGSRVLVRFP
jgi:hypothetical protein